MLKYVTISKYILCKSIKDVKHLEGQSGQYKVIIFAQINLDELITFVSMISNIYIPLKNYSTLSKEL